MFFSFIKSFFFIKIFFWTTFMALRSSQAQDISCATAVNSCWIFNLLGHQGTNSLSLPVPPYLSTYLPTYLSREHHCSTIFCSPNSVQYSVLQALRSLFSWFEVSFYLSKKMYRTKESLEDSIGTKTETSSAEWVEKENKERYQPRSSQEN